MNGQMFSHPHKERKKPPPLHNDWAYTKTNNNNKKAVLFYFQREALSELFCFFLPFVFFKEELLIPYHAYW